MPNYRTGIVVVTLAGLLTQAIWLIAVPFSWTWDSATNLAVGRFYFHLPVEHWNVWEYYAPSYGIFLSLLGIHHFESLIGVRIGVLLVGGTMPLLLYLMLWPLVPRAALLAALALALTFSNAVFSTNLLTYHLCAWTLLVMGLFLVRQLVRPSITNLILLAFAALVANSVRQVGFFVFIAAIGTLALALLMERHRAGRALTHSALLIAMYIAATGVLALGRQAVLGGPFQFGLTRDIGSRVAVQGAYYPASLFLKEFYPSDDPILVRPENGPASKKMFDGVAQFFARAGGGIAYLTPNEASNPERALHNLINQPTNITNSYLIWWGVDNVFGIDEGDKLSRRVWLETVRAQPRIVKYYLWNLWNSLFGPPMNMDYGCSAAPCFRSEFPEFGKYEFAADPIPPSFAQVAGPNLIAEMKRERERAEQVRPVGEVVVSIARAPFLLKPFLSALVMAAIFLVRGRGRYLAMFCALAVLANNGTTSLAFPLLPRYWTPVLPFVFAGAAISLVQIGGIVAELCRRLYASRH